VNPKSPPLPGFPAVNSSEPCASNPAQPALSHASKSLTFHSRAAAFLSLLHNVSPAYFPHQPHAFRICPNTLSPPQRSSLSGKFANQSSKTSTSLHVFNHNKTGFFN
jgi:hypothetical protein